MTNFMNDLQVRMFGLPNWCTSTTVPPFKAGDKVWITNLAGVQADEETTELIRSIQIVDSCTPAYVNSPLWDIDLVGVPYLFTSEDIKHV